MLLRHACEASLCLILVRPGNPSGVQLNLSKTGLDPDLSGQLSTLFMRKPIRLRPMDYFPPLEVFFLRLSLVGP